MESNIVIIITIRPIKMIPPKINPNTTKNQFRSHNESSSVIIGINPTTISPK